MHNFQFRNHAFFLVGLLIILITGACTEANNVSIPVDLDLPEGEATFLFFYTDN
ncbi:MAG: hypothetical protein ACPG7F_07975 [Aggregatilineales bacterium]